MYFLTEVMQSIVLTRGEGRISKHKYDKQPKG